MLAILSAILVDTIRLELFRGSCYGDSVMTFFISSFTDRFKRQSKFSV